MSTERHPDDPSVVRARYSASCPLCQRWIRKGRSWVEALPIELRPGLDNVYYEAVESPKGWRSCWTREPIDISHRRWGHKACVERFYRDVPPSEYQAFTEARDTELRDHRDRAKGASQPSGASRQDERTVKPE